MTRSAHRRTLLAGRFELTETLGAGGMGVVHAAIDHERNVEVALKRLASLSADSVLRFKNEFRALADIRHPNLIALGELFEDGGEWFFTMERIYGRDFLSYVRPGSAPLSTASTRSAFDLHAPAKASGTIVRADDHGGTMDGERLRSAMGQLARGLVALHDARKVHRDIKPSNILVTDVGRLVILDFGIVSDLSRRPAWDGEGEFVGTFAYMAPEQARVERVEPAADWYSVGVVLYEALTGHLPLSGKVDELLTLKQLVQPTPPAQVAPDVPPDLDALCVRLLRIEPHERPTGREVLRALGAGSIFPRTRPAHDGPFVGRTTELRQLGSALDDVRAGAAVTALLVGESGVGKSALVRRFVESAGATTVVLSGRCYERESVPFKAFDGIIDALSRFLGPSPDDPREPPLDATALAGAALVSHVFPVLRRVSGLDGATPALEGLDPQMLRARLFTELRALFARVAATTTLVLVIDDLQWADRDSLALLAALMRPPSAPAILLIATARAGAGAWHRELPGDVRVMTMGGLLAEDARALAAALLCEDPPSDEAQGLADAIAREASGHPLFIDELVRTRSTRGPRALQLDDALWLRIERLDMAARHALELVLVAGAPLEQELLADAAGMTFGELAAWVEILRSENLVRTSGARRSDSIEPYHDRVREAVLRRLDGDRASSCHARLAHVLDASGRADPDTLAVHYRGAGDTALALKHTVLAASRASEAFAFDRAARLFASALELAPDEAQRGDLAISLGEALANAGRGREAAEAYLTAASLRGPDDALDLRRRAAEQFLRSGHIDRATSTYGDVLAAVAMSMPKSPRRALVALLARRAEARLRGLSFHERPASDVPARDLQRVDTCWMVGAGLGLVDTIVGSYFQTRGLVLALDLGEPRRVARAVAGEAAFSSASGGRTRDRTALLVRTASEIAGRLGTPYEAAWAAGASGIAATLEGRWKHGHESCERAESVFRDRCTGAAWETGTMRWFSLWSLAYLGDIAELRTRIPRQRREAVERGDLYAEMGHSTGLANLAWLAGGDAASARAVSTEAMRKWSQTKFHVEHWWAMLGERQIDLYEGRGADALGAIDQAWRALDGSLLLMCQLTLLEALHLRARAALAAAMEAGADKGRLVKRALSDARRIAREAMPWSDPLAALLRAGASAILGDATRAEAERRAAVEGLHAAEMTLYARAAEWCADGERPRADAWMKSQGIADPARFVAMLAPGCSR